MGSGLSWAGSMAAVGIPVGFFHAHNAMKVRMRGEGWGGPLRTRGKGNGQTRAAFCSG